MKIVTPWQSPINNIAAIDKDLLKFYFDQAEKNLKSSVDLADRITTRCYTLLAIVIPVLSVILGTFAKSIITAEPLSQSIIWCLIITLAPLFTCLGLLVWTVFPKKYTYLGSSPKNKVIPSIFDNTDFPGSDSYKLMLTFELEEYQGRIEYVDEQNGRRVFWMKSAFIVIIVTLPIAAIGLIMTII